MKKFIQKLGQKQYKNMKKHRQKRFQRNIPWSWQKQLLFTVAIL